MRILIVPRTRGPRGVYWTLGLLGCLLATRPGWAASACPDATYQGGAAGAPAITVSSSGGTSFVSIAGCATAIPAKVRVTPKGTIITAKVGAPGCPGLGLSAKMVVLRVAIPAPACSTAQIRLTARGPHARQVAVGVRVVGPTTTSTTTPGNRPTTTTLPVTFTADVAPLLVAHCTSCHGAGGPAGGLSLTARAAYAALVNKPSTEQPTLLRVKPGDPAMSYLMRKIDGGPGISGGLMSIPASGAATIRAWIAGGAVK